MTFFTSNKNNGVKPSRRQSGLSLIELLVSVTLGVFLMGGVVTNFVGTKSSDKMRNAISEMDENARIALSLLRTTISQAGYTSINNTPFDEPFYTRQSDQNDVVTNKSCSGSATRYGSGTAPHRYMYTKDSEYGDYLTVGYLADNPCKKGLTSCPESNDVNPDAFLYSDCTGGGILRGKEVVSCSTDPDLGMPEAMDARIYNTFYLKRNGSANSEDYRNYSLACRGTRGGTIDLVDNIQYMQFLYGLTRSDGTTRYLSANSIKSKEEWSQVSSVRIGLMLRSADKNLLKEDGPSTKVLLDRTVRIYDRKRLYRTYITTISLLNRNQGVIR